MSNNSIHRSLWPLWDRAKDAIGTLTTDPLRYVPPPPPQDPQASQGASFTDMAQRLNQLQQDANRRQALMERLEEAQKAARMVHGSNLSGVTWRPAVQRYQPPPGPDLPPAADLIRAARCLDSRGHKAIAQWLDHLALMQGLQEMGVDKEPAGRATGCA